MLTFQVGHEISLRELCLAILLSSQKWGNDIRHGVSQRKHVLLTRNGGDASISHCYKVILTAS